MLPAARPLDGFAPPHPGGAVEVEEPAAAIARGLLDDKVAVEHDRLNFCKQRVVGVDVAPAHLHHADALIREIIDHAAYAVGARRKVRVKDQDKLAR